MDHIKGEKRQPGMQYQDQMWQYVNSRVSFLLLLQHTSDVFWYPISCFEVAYHITFIDFHTGLVWKSVW
jgi:hypothetical protein